MSQTFNQPLIIQRQRDLQYDVLNNLLSVSDDVISDEALRQKVVELKRLCMEIQMAPPEALAPPAPAADEGDQGDSFWATIAAELLKQGVDYVSGWFAPGRNVGLYNATGSAIFVRTYDQRDFLRWIPYGSWTIQPQDYATIAARGTDNIQADIGGRVYRCDIGGAYAFNGNTVVKRPS
jgi:hypothetical protein